MQRITNSLSSCEGSCQTENVDCDGFGSCWIVGSCCGATELLITDYAESGSVIFDGAPDTCTCLDS